MNYVDEVEARENEVRKNSSAGCLSYLGNWSTDDLAMHSGTVLDHGDLWVFTTQYKYMCQLANVTNYEGRSLTGKTAKNMERCLELGCDWGHCFPVFDNFFDEVHGIEVIASCVDAGVKNNRKIVRGVMEETPYDDNYFDVVISRHVLEHARSQDEILKEIYRITKPGGWSVHTLPCRVDGVVEPESSIHKCNHDYNSWLQQFIYHGFNNYTGYFSWNHNQEEFNIITRKVPYGDR